MEIKYIPFIIKNMKCFEQYIMSRFPKLGFMKELLGVCEINEKLIINWIINMSN